MANSKLKYTRSSEFLPQALINRLKELTEGQKGLDYRTFNNFIRCVGVIYHKQMHEQPDRFNYVATGSSYWKKIFGGNYHEKVIRPLLESDILQSYDFGYRTFNNDSKGKEKGLVGIRYRVNPNLFSDDHGVLEYMNGSGTISSSDDILYGGGKGQLLGLNDKNLLVSIDERKITRWIDSNAERICNHYLNREIINALPEDYQIEYHISICSSYNAKHGTVSKAKEDALKAGMKLFYFKNKFYIDDVNRFINSHIESLKYKYKHDVSKINQLPVIFKQNSKTLRVYNHLTNFPSPLLPFLTINNQTIVQVDLRNSQFLLLANLINTYIQSGSHHLLMQFKQQRTKLYLKRLVQVLDSHKSFLSPVGVDVNDLKSGIYSISDVTHFIRDVFFNDFYMVVKNDLNLGQRAIAKQVLFKILFGQSLKSDVFVKKLRDSYPVVMSIIADFKDRAKFAQGLSKSKMEDLTNLPVFLQCVEAELFIDHIFKPLTEKGVPCFTRHDSIVTAKEYEDEVEQQIRDVFNQFGFRLNTKTDDMFWDIVDEDALEESGYMDWLIGEDN